MLHDRPRIRGGTTSTFPTRRRRTSWVSCAPTRPATGGAPPAHRCTLGPSSSFGPSGRIANEAGEESCRCSYIVWLPFDGLGNRMLSMVSGFLYALLTGGGRGGDSWEGGGDLNRRGRTGRATRQGGGAA
jgi:hypothetical protein